MANPSSSGNRGTTGSTGTTGGTMGNLQNAGGNVAEKARDMARSATETARDAATGVMDRAKDMAGNVAETARDWASGAADAVKQSDVVNKAGEYVSDAWESGSRYFQEHSFKDMAEDVAGVIRRNPIPALLVGIGLGFILARSLRS
jgi:cell division septum initiation protein DivIVA